MKIHLSDLRNFCKTKSRLHSSTKIHLSDLRNFSKTEADHIAENSSIRQRKSLQNRSRSYSWMTTHLDQTKEIYVTYTFGAKQSASAPRKD